MTSAIRDYTRGFFLQLHVIHALVLRETRTAFGQYSLGYVWAFMSPALMIGIFAMMFYIGGRIPPSGMDPIGFLCTGFLTYNIFGGTMAKAMGAVSSNLGLLYYPQVHTTDLVAARCLLETVTLVISFFLFMFLNALHVEHFAIDSALRTLAGLGLSALLGTSLGLCFNSLILVFPNATHFVSIINRPLFWISGLFFSTHEVPLAVRELFLWNPVLHVVEITREGWFETYDYVYYDYWYIFMWIIGLAFIGLTGERMTRKYVGA